MISFANAKINIGLQILDRRTDGYHNLETVFYPIPLHDVLEVVEADEVRFIPSGIPIPGSPETNLCLQAYQLLAADFRLPPVHIYLHKVIPIGAGLGGGSADASFLLKLLNNKYGLGLSDGQLEGYARPLGADCAFFIRNSPVYAEGIGDQFSPVKVDLSGYSLVLVKPDVHISTSTAYRSVTGNRQSRQLSQQINRPVAEWKQYVFNDFEPGIFERFPEVRGVKAALYEAGALYVSMSGSGSSVYGIFEYPVSLQELEIRHQVFYLSSH